MSAVRDGIYGLCVGDALGVPAECCTREQLRQRPVTGMSAGGIRRQPPGHWSDDSSMTLCLADSIGEVGWFHTHDIMERFFRWFTRGDYTPGGVCFDFGHACARAIHRYQRDSTPALCGGKGPDDNGNGSLMRILPAAFVLYGRWGKEVARSSRAMREIHTLSGLTHRHPLAQSACGIYVSVACHLLDGEAPDQAVRDGVRQALGWYRFHSRFEKVLPYWERLAALPDLPEEEIFSGGYVVESLEASLWCLLHTADYRECVLRAVNLGHDADSTAAIAGGLAGICYGFAAIPQEWIVGLAGRDIIERCVEGLEAFCRTDAHEGSREDG